MSTYQKKRPKGKANQSSQSIVYLRTALFGLVAILMVAIIYLVANGALNPPAPSTASADKGSKSATKPAKSKTEANPAKQSIKPVDPPHADPTPPVNPAKPVETVEVGSGNPFSRGGVAQNRALDRCFSDEEATDRVAAEVVDALDDRPTLVIWLIDRTESCNIKRGNVARRLESIYQTLDAMKSQGHPAFRKKGDSPLLSAIVAFGKSVDFLTPEPTDDPAAIQKALSGITEDPEGTEMTFTAVKETVKKFLKYRTEQHRLVLLALLTDEVGDDLEQVDEAVELVHKNEIPVYVIGVPAAFGRSEALAAGPQMENNKPVRQGPEVPSPEILNLDYWSAGPAPQGNWPGNAAFTDMIDSGFGSYYLSRLCLESGGNYIAVRPADGAGAPIARFDPKALTRYRPEYTSQKKYDALLETNKACKAIHDAALLPRIEVKAALTLIFNKRDEAQLKRDLDKAQQAAARAEPKLREVYNLLAAGEPDRPKMKGPRWEASYDLAMGRILAARARIEGYNTMLALLKQGKSFPMPGQNTWFLQATATVKGDSALEKLAGQSHKYLDRVVKDHPDTPWAAMAQRELAIPMGWEWMAR